MSAWSLHKQKKCIIPCHYCDDEKFQKENDARKIIRQNKDGSARKRFEELLDKQPGMDKWKKEKMLAKFDKDFKDESPVTC